MTPEEKAEHRKRVQNFQNRSNARRKAQSRKRNSEDSDNNRIISAKTEFTITDGNKE